MAVDREDKKFDRYLADRRHRELNASMDNLAKVLSAMKDYNPSKALDEQTASIRAIIQSIKLPAPQVTVDQSTIVSTLEKVCLCLEELKKSTDTKPSWEFTVTRNSNGFIDKITAKQK